MRARSMASAIAYARWAMRSVCSVSAAIAEPSVSLERSLTRGSDQGLYLLTSGQATDHPLDVLRADSMTSVFDRLRNEFDWIVLDGPPVTVYSDAGALGRLVDGAVLVVRAESTRAAVIENAKKRLEQSGTRVLGAVLNRRRYHIPDFIYKWL